jgi:hypothetical protein
LLPGICAVLAAVAALILAAAAWHRAAVCPRCVLGERTSPPVASEAEFWRQLERRGLVAADPAGAPTAPIARTPA